MRLKISKSKNVTLYYVIKTIYIDGKEKTVTVEKLGNENDVLKKSKGKDPKTWAKNYVDNLNKLENENNLKIMKTYRNIVSGKAVERKSIDVFLKDIKKSFFSFIRARKKAKVFHIIFAFLQ